MAILAPTRKKGTIMVFGFGKSKVTESHSVAPASTTPPTPAIGKISLIKGATISLEKKAAPIIVSNGWKAKGKDYDLKALVRYRDGRTIYIGAANRDEVLNTPERAVVHSGDVKTPGGVETLTVEWHPAIASIAVSSYSALENGTGSFKRYGVYAEIKNGSQVVGIAADDANADGTSYTLLFGEILFGEDGQFSVSNLEKYSARQSERRVAYEGDKVVMDAGPKGQKK